MKARTVGSGKQDAHLMGIERQNIQLRLAFPEGEWGEAPGTSRAGTEMSVAVCAPESPAEDDRTTRRTAVYGPVRTVV